jgi:hypothetical protein
MFEVMNQEFGCGLANPVSTCRKPVPRVRSGCRRIRFIKDVNLILDMILPFIREKFNPFRDCDFALGSEEKRREEG